METPKTPEEILQTIRKYDNIIYSDDSEFRNFLENNKFEEVLSNYLTPRFSSYQDSDELGLIVPIVKFLLAEYILAFHVSCLRHLYEEYNVTKEIEFPCKVKETIGIYTINELYKILKKLDDQSIRRLLINVDDKRFSDLYESVRSSDFESFKRLLEDKSTSLYSKLIENEVFRFDVLSSKIVNNDKFYSEVLPSIMNLGFAVSPTIAECCAMLEIIYDLELCSFNIEKCTAFMNIYPVAMAEISRMIAQIQECEKFSTRERKELHEIIDRYSFLFEDIDLSLSGQSPESMEVIKRKAIMLGKTLHTNLLDELNLEPEENKDNEIIHDKGTIEDGTYENTCLKEKEELSISKLRKNRFAFPNVIGIQEPTKKASFLDSLFPLLCTNIRSEFGEITEDQFKYLFGSFEVKKPKDYPNSFVWTGPKYQFAMLLRILFDPEEQKTAQNGFIVLSTDYEKNQVTKWTSGTSIQASNQRGPSSKLKKFSSQIVEIIKQHGGKYKGELHWVRDL